jgi:hypothetical protein
MEKEDSAVYAQTCEHYRYFLSWRDKTLGGYLILLGALGIAYANLDKTNLWFFPPFAVIFVSIVFWLLEFRTRDLYHMCSWVGERLERDAGVKGFFGVARLEHSSKGEPPISQSFAFDFLISGVVSFAIAFCVWRIFGNSDSNTVWWPNRILPAGLFLICLIILTIALTRFNRARRRSHSEFCAGVLYR